MVRLARLLGVCALTVAGLGCIEDPDECDLDGDGFYRWDCGGLDCDDDRDDIHPAAADECDDGLDQNCDGWDKLREGEDPERYGC